MATLSLLKKIRDLVKKGEHEEALSMCNDALSSDPLNHELIRERISLLEKTERAEEALVSLRKLAADSDEPADYFDLARMYIRRKKFDAAIQEIDVLLEISSREGFSYYTSSAKFLRAFALIETGRKREAMDDIQSLDGDMRFWVPGRGLVTVDQLKSAV